MRFTSRYAGQIIPILDEKVHWNSDGQKRVVRPAVFADFGESADFGEEVRITGLDGEPDHAPDIRSGIYDTDEAAAAHGWNEEEKEEVERRLLELCPNGPQGDQSPMRRVPGSGWGDVRLWERAKLEPPWPKYEEALPSQIAAMADPIGLVEQALLYEQRRDPRREDVIASLLARRETVAEAETLTAAEA